LDMISKNGGGRSAADVRVQPIVIVPLATLVGALLVAEADIELLETGVGVTTGVVNETGP
jgi:hypothetical protein